MTGFNKVIMMGNVTADPELKQASDGTSVCRFSLAVNRPKAKEGAPACDFFTVVAWRQAAEFVARNFTKGKPMLLCGEIRTNTWTDKNGNKHKTYEILADSVHFAGGKEDPQPSSQTESFEDVLPDDSLPF